MQEEISEKIIALSIRATEMSARTLQDAIRKYLAAQKPEELPGHKTNLRKMMAENQELTNLEITDQNIRSFERTARKYGLNYALKKDKSQEPFRYLVFFKAKDVKVMNAAFREFSHKQLHGFGAAENEKSIRKQLERVHTAIKNRIKRKEQEQTR